MTTTPNRLGRLLASSLLAVAAVGGLAACDDEEKEQAGTTQPSGNADTSPGQGAPGAEDAGNEDNDTEPDAEETETAPEPDDDPVDASATGCLVGTWLVDNAAMGALFEGAAQGSGATLSEPTGKVLLTFGPNGEYQAEYQDWTMEVSSNGVTMEMHREGTDTGSYQATDDGTIEWSEAEMGSVTTLDSPSGSMQVPGEPSGASGTFACAQDTLELSAQGSTTVLHRQ